MTKKNDCKNTAKKCRREIMETSGQEIVVLSALTHERLERVWRNGRTRHVLDIWSFFDQFLWMEREILVERNGRKTLLIGHMEHSRSIWLTSEIACRIRRVNLHKIEKKQKKSLTCSSSSAHLRLRGWVLPIISTTLSWNLRENSSKRATRTINWATFPDIWWRGARKFINYKQ